MKRLRDKKLIIILGILVLFALSFVGCTNDEVGEPIEEPAQEEQIEDPFTEENVEEGY